MKPEKRTYWIRSDVVRRFEALVEPGRRSVVVDRLIMTWLQAHDKESLRAQVIEGCHAMSAENLASANEEWF